MRGVHHLALIARDVEETITLLPGPPRVPAGRAGGEPRLQRAPATSSSTSATATCSGFFDFPGHDHPEFPETIGAVQHLALSATQEDFDAAKKRLDEAGIDYIGPDRGIDNSIYVRDPNGVGLEFYVEELGVFEGDVLL